MKRKIFYMLILLCSLGIITSAKQSKNNCCRNINCVMSGSANPKPVKSEPKESMGFELSPLQFFVFDV